MTNENVEGKKNVNDRSPNFRSDDGHLYLMRCFVCGRENWAMAVASGQCCWCGWEEQANEVSSGD